MIKKFININILIFISIFYSSNINAHIQKNQNHFEISILSIGEGSSLVDAFGHTAIRVKGDGVNELLEKVLLKEYLEKNQLKNDVVFNFGVYNFNSPNFYSNFVKGRPEYILGIQNYNNLIQNYIRQKRYIVEHQLYLDQNSTKIIVDLLLEKLKNPSYIYDYFRDNCTTRSADIIIDKTNNKFKDDKLENEAIPTYRELIHGKLNENSWAAVGIDLCLGAIIDKKINIRETFFLPENFMNYLNMFESDIIKRNIIYSPKLEMNYHENLPSPLLVNTILSLIIIVITILNYKSNKWNKSLDTLIFLITGSIGILIIYLWFFSNHFAGAQNFNLLWAFPLNFGLIFCIFKNKIPGWTISYLKFLIILICLLLLHWITGVQKYNITLLSIFIALIIRYAFLISHIKRIIK
tara:strand:- start:3864 stop:5087 length:1224 start_codon:yes stop_codon:yes gene_type:complete